MVKKVLLIGSICIAFAATCVYCFRNLGNWLIVSDPLPSEIDVLFCFGGADDRLPYAIELQKKYPGTVLLVSGINQKTQVTQLGGDTARIEFVDTCKTTWAETYCLESWIKSNFGEKTVIVALVSSPYHMRRIKMMMMRRGNGNITFFYLPVTGEKSQQYIYDYKKWWEKKDLRNIAFSEIKKMVYFVFLIWP